MKTALPRWVSAVVIVGAVLMMAGGVIALINPAMLVAKGEEINSAARVYAGYLVSRNVAIAAMLLITLAARARAALSSTMALTAVIQLLDAGIDCMEARWTLVPGVALLAIAFFMGARRVSEKPLRWFLVSGE